MFVVKDFYSSIPRVILILVKRNNVLPKDCCF